MRLGTEALLMLLAAGLYLFDSASLLAVDEAFVVRGRRGRWHAGFGADRWRLGGKEPHLQNPFTPHAPVFRLHWRLDSAAIPAAGTLPTPALVAVPPELVRLGPLVLGIGVCLFVLLPLALFGPLGTAFTLAVIASLYLIDLWALTMLFSKRMALGLSTRQFASIAFECLVCPPFSVNLIRKVCARMHFAEDFTAAAHRLMQADERATADASCLRRLDEQIDIEAEGTPRMRALLQSRARFVPASPPASVP